jgi:hypothetical protein
MCVLAFACRQQQNEVLMANISQVILGTVSLLNYEVTKYHVSFYVTETDSKKRNFLYLTHSCDFTLK